MKKLLAIISGLAMVLCLAACTANEPKADPADSATPAGNPAAAPAESDDISVALILPGVITDESWCYTAYQGLTQLEEQGYKTQYVENVDTSNCESIAMNFVDDGYTLVIAHGSQFGDAMIRVAQSNSDRYFFVYGKAPVDNYPDNIGFVDTAVYHATYVCGYLAAKMSQSGAVGYIGGSESAGQLTMKNAYAEGALAANPEADVLTIMTGSTDDTALGKESALSMINQGVDVIMHAADTTGLGVIEACSEKNVYCMGYGSDQHDLAPDLMLTSVVEIVPPVIASQVDRIKEGSFGGVYKPGLGVGVELAELNADIIPADLIAEISDLVDGVTDGSVAVTESYEK